MADKASENTGDVAAQTSSAVAPAPASADAKADKTKSEGDKVEAAEEAAKTSEGGKPAADATEEAEPSKDATADNAADGDLKDEGDTTMADADVKATATASVETPSAKSKSNRRKSGGGGLGKRGSKARLTHTDAKPGEHFLVKLKGFPAWPAIICDEDMLPHALVTSRPVSALRPDGTYAEAFADGGKRVNDRTFPVMYLHTNEFGWEKNTNLSELSAEKAKDTINDKMRKDLKAAFELAIEHHPIQYYKDILKSFQDELIAQEEARKEAAATPKKAKKGKTKAVDDEENTEMADAEPSTSVKKSKKRKAEDEAATPQRNDSVKKPKIKLNTSSTPKTTTNGAAAASAASAAPKSGSGSAAKTTKVKAKKAKDNKEVVEKKTESSKEKLTPEQRHSRKVKEVLFLRHKLQKGLLTREQKPKEEEMSSMADYISVLEKFGNLEVSIIRETKINKVLKAVLKLDAIPREDEFHFKKRSQVLLDKWNKLLAGESSVNGVNGGEHGEGKNGEANGVKPGSESKSAEASAVPKADGADAAETVEGKAED